MFRGKENTKEEELFDLSPPSMWAARCTVELNSSSPTTPVFTSSYRGSTPTRRHTYSSHANTIRVVAPISREGDHSRINLSGCATRRAQCATPIQKEVFEQKAQVESERPSHGCTPPRTTPTRRRPGSPTRVETPPRVPGSRFGQTRHTIQEEKDEDGRRVGIPATDQNTFFGSSTSESFVYFNSGDGHHFSGGSPRGMQASPPSSTPHRRTSPYLRRGEEEAHHHYNYTPTRTATAPSEEVRRGGQQQKPLLPMLKEKGYGNMEERNTLTHHQHQDRGVEKEASSQAEPKGEYHYCSSSEADGRGDEMQIAPSLNVSPIRNSPQRRGSLSLADEESNKRSSTSGHTSPSGGRLNCRGEVKVTDLQRPTSPINPILTQLRSSVIGVTGGSHWASKYERAPSLPSPSRKVVEPYVLAMSSNESQETREGAQDAPNARTPKRTKNDMDTVNDERYSSSIKSSLFEKSTIPPGSSIRSAAVVHYPNTRLYNSHNTNVFGSDLIEEARRSGLLPSSSKGGSRGRDAARRGASASSSTISQANQSSSVGNREAARIVNGEKTAGKDDAKGRAKSRDDDDDDDDRQPSNTADYRKVQEETNRRHEEERSPSPTPLSRETQVNGKGTITKTSGQSMRHQITSKERGASSSSLMNGECKDICRLVQFSTTKTTLTMRSVQEQKKEKEGEGYEKSRGERDPSSTENGVERKMAKQTNGVEGTVHRIECRTQNSNKTATEIEERLMLITSANPQGQAPQGAVAAVPPHPHIQYECGFREEESGGGLSGGTIYSSSSLHYDNVHVSGAEGRKKSGTVRRVYTVGVGMTTVPAHLPTSLSRGAEVSVVATRRGEERETDNGGSVVVEGSSRRSSIVKLESKTLIEDTTIRGDKKGLINAVHDDQYNITGLPKKEIMSLPYNKEHTEEDNKKAIAANKAGHPAETYTAYDHREEGRRRGKDNDVSSSKLAKIVATVSSSSRVASPPPLALLPVSSAKRSSSSAATTNESSSWRKAAGAKEAGRESSTATEADGKARANNPKKACFPAASRSPSPRGTFFAKTTSPKKLVTSPSSSRSRSQQQQQQQPCTKRQHTDKSRILLGKPFESPQQGHDEEASQIKTSQQAERRMQKYAQVGALVGSFLTQNASSSPPSRSHASTSTSSSQRRRGSPPSPLEQTLAQQQELQEKEEELILKGTRKAGLVHCAESNQEHHHGHELPPPTAMYERVSLLDENEADYRGLSVSQSAATSRAGTPRSAASVPRPPMGGTEEVNCADTIPDKAIGNEYGRNGKGPLIHVGAANAPSAVRSVNPPTTQTTATISFPLSTVGGGLDYSRTTTANYLNFSRAISAVAEGSDAVALGYASYAPTPTLFVDSSVSPLPPATYVNVENAESSSVTSLRPKPLRGAAARRLTEESSRSYNNIAEQRQDSEDTMKKHQPVDDASLVVPCTAPHTSRPQISRSTTPVPFPSSTVPVPHAALVPSDGAFQFERDASVPPQPSSSEPPKPMPSPTTRAPRYDVTKSNYTMTSEVTAAEKDDISSVALPVHSSSSSLPILASHLATVRTAPPSPRNVVRSSLSSSSTLLTPNSQQPKAEKGSKKQKEQERYGSSTDVSIGINHNKNAIKEVEKEDIGRGGVASSPLRLSVTSPKRMSNTVVPPPPSTVRALRSPRDDNGNDRGLVEEGEEECKQGVSNQDQVGDKVGNHPIASRRQAHDYDTAHYATRTASSSRWSAGVSRDVEGGHRKLATNTPPRSSVNSSLLSSSSSFHVRHSDTTTLVCTEGNEAAGSNTNNNTRKPLVSKRDFALTGTASAQSNRSSPLHLHHRGTPNGAHIRNTRVTVANTKTRTTSSGLLSAAADEDGGGGDLSLRNVLEEAARLKATRDKGSVGTPTSSGGGGLQEYLSLTRLEPLSPNRRSSPNFRGERPLGTSERIDEQVHQHQTALTPSSPQQQSSLSSLEERPTHATHAKNADKNDANTLSTSAESRERSLLNSDTAQRTIYARTTALSTEEDSSGAETRWRKVGGGADVPTRAALPIVESRGIGSDVHVLTGAVRPVPVKVISAPTTEDQKNENRRYDPISVRGSPLRWGAAIGQRQTHSLPSKMSNRWPSALLDEAQTENKQKRGGEVCWNANSQSLPVARTRWSSDK